MKKINAFSKIVVTNALYFVLEHLFLHVQLPITAQNRPVNHISRYKNLSKLISQQQILAIHGSRKNPLPPSKNNIDKGKGQKLLRKYTNLLFCVTNLVLLLFLSRIVLITVTVVFNSEKHLQTALLKKSL